MIGERKDATVIRSDESGSSLFVYGSLIDPGHRAEIIGHEVEASRRRLKATNGGVDGIFTCASKRVSRHAACC